MESATTIYDLPGIKSFKKTTSSRQERDGVEIKKGVKLFPSGVDENFDFFARHMDFFINYPDLFIDLITPTYSHFQLYFYQRISKIVPCYSNVA